MGAADDDGFPAREEEREQTEDDRAPRPRRIGSRRLRLRGDSAVNHAAYGAALSGYTVAIIAGARRDRRGLPGRNHSLDGATLIARACRQSRVWNNWRGEKLNGRIAE
jgi:hypothetical protein